MSSPSLEKEKWEYFKERDQEFRALAFMRLQKAWKYEYVKLVSTIVVLILLVVLIWQFLQKSDTTKDTNDKNREKFAPYPSILTHDIYRSDPAFDYSKPEVQLTADSVTW